MPEEVMILIFVGIVSGTVLLGSVVRTVGRYFERKAERETRALGAEGESLRAETGDLRADVDMLRGEVIELQERLDFAERLLAQQREAPPARLGRGTEGAPDG